MAALVVGLVLGALANVLYGAFSGDTLVWGSFGKLVLTYFAAYVLAWRRGFAFGALFLNSAGRHRRLLRLLVRPADDRSRSGRH